MSSILRALKKLEEESTPRESESQPVEHKIKKSRLKRRQAGASPAVNKFLVVLAVVLLLGIVGWLIINPTGSPTISVPPPTPALKEALPGESPADERSGEQTKPSAGAPGSESRQPPQPPKAEEPIQPVADKTIDRETKAKHPALNLTGILWSEVPGRRLALINSRYLKEGEKINGVTLIRIEENAVAFQSGAETWTVELDR
ncbi:MAG: general secretion pathway protein GspB [Candidatus Aminicenantes bacterium]|nr:general secretion pathway protein GspB [Candidatus Aminicenantes bacterium]